MGDKMMIGKPTLLTSALKVSLVSVVAFALLHCGCSQDSNDDDAWTHRDGGTDGQVTDAVGQDTNNANDADIATGGSAGAEAGPDGNNAGTGGSSGGAGGAGGAQGGAGGAQGGAGGQAGTGGVAGAGGMATGGEAGAPPAGGSGGAPSFTPCKQVLHIGDSLSADYVTNMLVQSYQKVGVTAKVDAHGSRSVLNKVASDPYTGEQAAKKYASEGYSGCWVVALGTNDVGHTGGKPDPSKDRIDAMMNAIDPTGKARVMWVNVYVTDAANASLVAAFPGWNEALVVAKSRWPNMHVYDWASVAKTGAAPFAGDGVHHTSKGYQVRSDSIAKAVVTEGVGP